jgi:hypothetical protein
VLLIVSLVLVAFTALATTAFAQATTPTPATLPTTGGEADQMNVLAIVLLALGATAGLGGLLLRGLHRPV